VQPLPIEHFGALTQLPHCRHVFTKRFPGIDVSHDKAEALRRLEAAHREIRRAIGVSDWPVLTAEQVHGDQIAVVAEPDRAGQLPQQKPVTDRSDTNRRSWATQPIGSFGCPSGATRVDLPIESDVQFAGCDGIITNQRKVALGIHVADCCAVYIVDPKKPAIGLVHSGKKGTELGVVSNAIAQMKAHFGSNPAELVVQLSPCIRPPHYEVDFAAEIIGQCRAQGVKQNHKSGISTACHLDLYYSYRAEKGKTGRMLALLALM